MWLDRETNRLLVALLALLALLAVGVAWSLSRDPGRGTLESSLLVEATRATGEEAEPLAEASPPAFESEPESELEPELHAAERTVAKSAAELGAADLAPGTLRVRVVDERGRPVEGLRVRWKGVEAGEVPPDFPKLEARPGWRLARGRTGAEGVLDLTRVEPGLVRVTAGREWDWAFHLSEPVELVAERGAEVTVVTRPPPAERLVTGRVVKPDGKPASRVRVELSWRHGFAARKTVRTRTDAFGEFRLLPPSSVRDGTLRATPDPDAWRPVVQADVAAGSRGHLLPLGEPRYFEVLVRGVGGEQLDPRYVKLEREHEGGWNEVDPLSPGWRGHPRRWALPTERVRLLVFATGYAAQTLGPFEPDALEPLRTVELVPLPRVSGRVVHAGKPVGDVEVTLRPTQDPYLSRGEGRPLHAQPWLDTSSSVGDGEFSFQVTPGSYEFRAWVPGLGAGRLEGVEVGAADVIGLVLELSEAQATLRGRVVPPPGYRADEIYFGPRHGPQACRLKKDGSYELRGLEPGPHLLSAKVLAPEGPRDLAPTEAQRVAEALAAGTLVGEGLRGPDSADRSATEAGFELVPNSRLREAHLPWSPMDLWLTVRLAPGEVRELDVDLSAGPACRLLGRLRLEGGFEELPSLPAEADRGPLEAMLVDDASGPLLSLCPVSDGFEFRLGSWEPGACRLRLRAWGSHLPTITDRVVLSRGEQVWERTIEFGALDLEPPGALMGSATALRPHVEWHGPGELRAVVEHCTERDDSGALRYPLVPAGRVLVGRVLEDGSIEVVGEVTVEPGLCAVFRFPDPAPPPSGSQGDDPPSSR